MLASVDRDIIVYNIDGLSRMPKCIMIGVTQQRYLYNYIGESYMPGMNLHKTTPSYLLDRVNAVPVYNERWEETAITCRPWILLFRVITIAPKLSVALLNFTCPVLIRSSRPIPIYYNPTED